MNYRHPQLLDELAAQYVLGTLRGRARRRFERVYAGDAAAHTAVRKWEDRLADLLAQVAPVAPSAAVWERIRFRVRREKSSTRSVWEFSRMALAAGVAALAIGIGLYLGFGPGHMETVATVSDKQQAQLWRIEARSDREALRVVAAANLELDPERAYELWALPGENAAPVSLGLMPKSGRGTLQLNANQRAALARSHQVAISLEPPGGSPTGAPTGPVLFVANVVTG